MITSNHLGDLRSHRNATEFNYDKLNWKETVI
jgi:hypothetical protein